jgi:hypothetical protein
LLAVSSPAFEISVGRHIIGKFVLTMLNFQNLLKTIMLFAGIWPVVNTIIWNIVLVTNIWFHMYIRFKSILMKHVFANVEFKALCLKIEVLEG